MNKKLHKSLYSKKDKRPRFNKQIMLNNIDLEKKINSELNTKVSSSKIVHETLNVSIEKDDLKEVLLFLKSNPDMKFKQLIDITAVDYPNKKNRFRMIYLLLSHEFNKRIIIDFPLNENEKVFSITSIFPSANWMEREVFDMYGIDFQDHPDLRRILTDYEFEGYPLRKDFPITGHKEVRYSEEKKKVIYEPVKLEQDYRNFDYSSPWQGTEYIKEIKKNNE